MKPISEQIKHYREREGLTQKQLSDKTGLSGHNIISYYENGQRTPSIQTLKNIATILRCQFVISGDKVIRSPDEILR